jgi:hypothetical protein
MTERLKVLDCNRKAILGLPSPAFHLWMCYWMNEDDEQESYMSLDEIESQVDARISRRTIITWTQWLVAKGWLVDTGKTAADKFIQRGKTATRGAHQIRVYRVDDPTKGISQQSSKISPVQNLHQCNPCTSAESAPVQIAHKVSSSCSGSGSDSDSSSGSTSTSHSDSESAAAPRGGKEKVKNGDQNLKTKTGTKTKQRHAADGTPWPEGFDSKWDNVQRTNWLKDHDGSEESRKERERWERQLAISSRVGPIPPMTTAAAAPPPAPINQSERQTVYGFPED